MPLSLNSCAHLAIPCRHSSWKQIAELLCSSSAQVCFIFQHALDLRLEQKMSLKSHRKNKPCWESFSCDLVYYCVMFCLPVRSVRASLQPTCMKAAHMQHVMAVYANLKRAHATEIIRNPLVRPTDSMESKDIKRPCIAPSRLSSVSMAAHCPEIPRPALARRVFVEKCGSSGGAPKMASERWLKQRLRASNCTVPGLWQSMAMVIIDNMVTRWTTAALPMTMT